MRGCRFPLKEKFESMWASRYGADVERSLGGRRELHDATRGARWISEGSSIFPNRAVSDNKGENVFIGSRALKTGYRHNVEPCVIFFEGVPEGAMFRGPLDHEFFYPS